MKLIVSGNTPAQKNRKKIVWKRGMKRPSLVTEKPVKDWQKRAKMQLVEQLPIDYQSPAKPVSITIIVFWADRIRRDLDNAANSIMDALVKAQVIADDSFKYVDCIDLQYGGVDADNPRCEIYIDIN